MAVAATNLATGTGSVSMSADLPAGRLIVDAQEFTHGRDRTVIAHGQVGKHRLYRGVFSVDDERTVFAVITDNGVTTRLAMHDDSARANVGIVEVWNDGQPPQSFDVDIKKFIKTRDVQQSVLATRGAPYDPVGSRKPPKISAAEVANAFVGTDAFRSFMRGAEHHERILKNLTAKAGTVNWKCAWTCTVPACGILCLLWRIANPPPKPQPKKGAG
jgi:hypothetical protein